MQNLQLVQEGFLLVVPYNYIQQEEFPSSFLKVHHHLKRLLKKREPIEQAKALERYYELCKKIMANPEYSLKIIKKYMKKTRLITIEKIQIEKIKMTDVSDLDKLNKNKYYIIQLDKTSLPPLAYIGHKLHLRLVDRILFQKPKEEKLVLDRNKIDSLDENKKEYFIMGVITGLEPLFALVLMYNGLYKRDYSFFNQYFKMINSIAVKFSKVVPLTANNTVDKETLIEMYNDLRKARDEGLL